MIKLSKVLLSILAAVAFLFCCCTGILFQLPIDVPYTLVTGWAYFLVRVIREITVDWAGTFTAVVAVAGLAFGLHLFLRWLFNQVQQTGQATDQSRPAWQLRWTVALLSVVVLMFVAGIAAVGVTHQTTWLATSPEPILAVSGKPAEAQTRNNLQQQGLAVRTHYDVFKVLPAGGTFDKYGRGLHGWQAPLLPYLEEGALFKRIKLDVPWHDDANKPAFQVVVYAFHHPSEEERDAAGFALSQYASNVRVMGGGRPLDLKKDFPHGTSNTLLLGEAAGNYRPWGHHANWRDPALGINTTLDGFGNNERKVAHFVLVDGSIRTLSNRTSPNVLMALSTPAGGEKLPDNWDEN
jgi:hypothetical protein